MDKTTLTIMQEIIQTGRFINPTDNNARIMKAIYQLANDGIIKYRFFTCVGVHSVECELRDKILINDKNR